MKHDKTEKALYLFREIGGIDERLIHEAIFYRPKKSALPRVLLVAAALSLSLVLAVGAFLITMQTQKGHSSNDAITPPTDQNEVPPTLDSILLSQSDKQNAVASDAIEFFGGNAYVVWQRTDSNEIYVSRALTSHEVKRLTSEIANGTPIQESEAEPLCRVWILLGDGSTVSPYLEPSNGNVGAAELFDYHAELIPSTAFNSTLSEILN